jgi:hypothetical protein
MSAGKSTTPVNFLASLGNRRFGFIRDFPFGFMPTQPARAFSAIFLLPHRFANLFFDPSTVFLWRRV